MKNFALNEIFRQKLVSHTVCKTHENFFKLKSICVNLQDLVAVVLLD